MPVHQDDEVSKSRNFCWTHFQLDDDPKEMFGNYTWIEWQKETCPTSGRIHLQGYTCYENNRSFNNIRRMSKVNKLFCMKGSVKSNHNYCADVNKPSYLDGPWNDGKEPDWTTFVGQRNDLVYIGEQIKLGKRPREIYEECPGSYARYYRNFGLPNPGTVLMQQVEFRKVEVNVLWGEPGVGKTKVAYNRYRWDEVAKMCSKDPEWWSDTWDPKCLLIDEYVPGEMKIQRLDEICDGWPLQLPIKGGFINCPNVETVYICSNHDMTDRFKHTPMERRITDTIKID